MSVQKRHQDPSLSSKSTNETKRIENPQIRFTTYYTKSAASQKRKKTPKMMPKTNNKETVLERKEENSKHIIIVHPTDKDVLCGRGRGNFFHQGNQRFREIVGTSLQLYLTASSRSQKSKVVKATAEKVLEQGARFLKQERGSCDWYEAGVQTAREKVSA
jgi:hypothetical protein